ncbi:MAG TPA: MoxR family ATPase [Roseiflexaceae bacterium]|nr:MoxR family ATPase [Roseiflexaceae bacterium]
MTPAELSAFLTTLVQHQVQLSTMIWGPPGIGKSSIVAQVAAAHGLECVDLRLSQLAPTDLRGLPVAQDGLARWFPPEFLPQDGAGVLFLDEINLAPPTMQGMAQQLVLDRRVGSYRVPEGWYIWAAGNRQEDAASVFEMPAPVANRFLHVEVAPDLDSFKAYALTEGLHEQIVAFLSFRPALLHRFDPNQPAWPSPRSWAMASALHRIGLEVQAAVGAAAGAEFHAYVEVYNRLPDLAAILRGEGGAVVFPEEPSVRYATTVGLAARAATAEEGHHALRWLIHKASAEWVQLCAVDLFRVMRTHSQMRRLRSLIGTDPALQEWLEAFGGTANA